ncbi:MAG TPA: hypothetical protein DGD08_04585 [Gemmatimonas aurantiaca]|uniref:Uncharacterized protein n=2 Tax=Gemmatimonas aurantiaca TaxID=173480 RepID=C1ADC4_GEMAT|nr:hypothetical protein [Gemmatimonas aurantiaca]BAH40501.1 hypothetical protein GAU_3459 [Gemmatimonas aurantiaca T-27]HCT56472.1 hypothetical protein [Gemmatimonas aurantiaca]
MSAIERVSQLRNTGVTTCTVVDLPSPGRGTSVVDQVVQGHGFRGIASEWIEVSAADAHAIVTTLLHRDLAYGTKLMSLAAASDLATPMFDAVPEPHTYFTNGDWTMNPSGNGEATLHGWNPISDATFDSGVVCLGDGRAAVFWIQDED